MRPTTRVGVVWLLLVLFAATYVDVALAVSPFWVAGGQGHSVLSQVDGSVFTWGLNTDGQLGQGDMRTLLLPQVLSSFGGVKAVAAGANHTLFLRQDGTVWAAGDNTYGQLGDGTSGSGTEKPVPVQVVGLANVVAISAGYEFSVALKEDGTVWAWGRNDSGQLGNGTQQHSSVPVQVVGLPAMQKIAAGGYHALGLTASGVLCGWGSSMYYQLAQKGVLTTPMAITLPEPADIIAIAAGGYHSLALTSDGRVWSWGRNNYGQLGRYGSEQEPAAAAIEDSQQIAAGSYHSLALKRDGTVWVWGSNYQGQLGCSSPLQSAVPVQVGALPNITAIASGNYHSLAFDQEGHLYAWGLNDSGQLGNGTQSGAGPAKVQVPVTEIMLTPDSISLAVGESVSLEAVVHPVSAANRELLWQSTDPAIATVDSTGVVTGLAVGAVNVIVTSHDGSVSAVCTVKVGSTVSGRVMVEGHQDSAGVDVKLLDSSSQVVAEMVTDASGDFSLAVPQAGSYMLSLALPGWLYLEQAVDVILGENVDVGVLQLYRGDINADGTIDRRDLELLAAAIGSQPGDAHWNALADVDGSGMVNVLDLLHIVPNVGRE